MRERGLLPGEFAVLALLKPGEMHGYEMARCLERDELMDVCPVEQSLLYTYLRNVEERGLVTWREVRAGRRPPRKVFSLTEQGRTRVDGWLSTPVQRMREVRLEFLLKLYFLAQSDRSRGRELIVKQIHVCEEYRARLEQRYAECEGFSRLVAGSKLSAAAATLDWLRRYASELESTDSEQE